MAQLRADEPLEEDVGQQALLRHEIAVLEEARGDAKAAASEYLAAYNSEPDFREPLEALVRMLSRTREDKSLGKLLETLVDAATDPAESGRALWELAAYRADVQADVAGARNAIEDALAVDPNDPAIWLALELAAIRGDDAEARARAVEARGRLAQNPTLQGTLLIELAELRADAGAPEEAAKLLDEAVALEGRARFRSRMVLERLARGVGDAELQALALEGQAELIAAGVEDAAEAERTGVPRCLCSATHAAECWLRAGELRRRSGDPWGAAAALTSASQRLGASELALRLRLAAADAAGDSGTAVQLARGELERGVTGPVGAAMWVRLALAAEEDGAQGEAIHAYAQALEMDPQCALAEALRVDLLARGADGTALAQAVEESARRFSGDDSFLETHPELASAAQARWFVAAFAWVARAKNSEHAKRALEQCGRLGAAPALLARVERMLASLVNDGVWYEKATAAMLEIEPSSAGRASLGFELGRARLLRGDRDGAEAAFVSLAAVGEVSSDDSGAVATAWLGRALAAYGCGLGNAARPRADAVALFARSQDDALLGRGLVTVAAWLALREGGEAVERAVALLLRENEQAPGDLTVALLLVDALRRSDLPAAARVLGRTAAAVVDPGLAGALQLEAGLLLWNAGLKREAATAFEQALEPAPFAARRALSWALRGVDPDDKSLRRRVAELAEDSETERAAGALERFGLSVVDREGEADAWVALEQLDQLGAGGDLAVSTALARMLWASEAIEPPSFDAALATIEPLGAHAAILARGERYRRARFVERDAAAALGAARAWAESDPGPHTALEWLAAAFAADDRPGELHARRAFARQLEGTARLHAIASAATVAVVQGQGDSIGMFDGDEASARLMNLELALPGSAPERRARALRGLGDALGEDAGREAERLAAWSDLARGAATEAREAFQQLCERDPKDLASWEGLRSAAEALGDFTTLGITLARLGAATKNDERAAELWEKAGITLLDHTQAHDDAEIAFERSLARDPRRSVAFDKLFRRVRSRNDDDKLLALIAKRIEVTDDTTELTKMYWERARVLRRKGDIDGALVCLRDVTLLKADHVAALALLGEIRINRGEFAEAAPVFARLATLTEAPDQQRRVSGVAAADLYEKKLEQPDKALEVLTLLHREKLSTLPIRERLAKLAARVGQWADSAAMLEELMTERESSGERAEAARLAMAIYRDKLREPKRAQKAVARLLQEIPDDPEAIELVLRVPLEALKQTAVVDGRRMLLERLAREPMDAPRVRMVAEIAAAQAQPDAQRAALGVLAALSEPDDALKQTIVRLDARMIHQPAITLDQQALGEICHADDIGALAELFAVIAEVVSTALGPSIKSEAVGRKDKLETGDALRAEVARWMGALGFDDFDLYLGTKHKGDVIGVAAEKPTLIVGCDLKAPLDAAGRAAVARAAFALRRGISAVLHYDEHTIASIVASVSNDAGVAVPEPPFAVFKDVDRTIKKAMSRKVRKLATGMCASVLETRQGVGVWAEAARRSIDRMSLIAAGDAATVIDAIVGARGTPARGSWEADQRASSLLAFALSADYLALRHKLGMGMK